MISVFSLRLERLRKKRQTSNETCRRVMDFFTTSFDVFFDFFWELDMCTFFLRYIYIHPRSMCKSDRNTLQAVAKAVAGPQVVAVLLGICLDYLEEEHPR